MKKRIVVALGGNALGNSAKEQREAVGRTSLPIVDLIEKGHEVVIVHGNGPQVGMINLAMDQAEKTFPSFSEMPITVDFKNVGYITTRAKSCNILQWL